MSKVPSVAGNSNVAIGVINHKPKNENSALKRKLMLPLDTIDKKMKPNSLRSPHLEGVMVTPDGVTTPVVKSIVFPDSITEEQKRFAEGFDRALEDCKNEKYEAPVQTHMTTRRSSEKKEYAQMNTVVSQPIAPFSGKRPAAPAATQKTTFLAPMGPYYTIDANDLNNHQHRLEEVPLNKNHVVPSYSMPMPHKVVQSKMIVPVNLESQEHMKMDRKRERNRDAARKCRERKLQKIAELQDQVEKLKQHNSSLSSRVESLKGHLAQLDQQVREHQRAGCAISYILRFS